MCIRAHVHAYALMCIFMRTYSRMCMHNYACICVHCKILICSPPLNLFFFGCYITSFFLKNFSCAYRVAKFFRKKVAVYSKRKKKFSCVQIVQLFFVVFDFDCAPLNFFLTCFLWFLLTVKTPPI